MLIASLLVGAGLLVGRVTASAPQPSRPAPSPRLELDTAQLDELRRAVVTSVRIEKNVALPPVELEPEPEPEPEAVDRDAHDRAFAIVDAAVARGVWTEADRQAVNRDIAALPREARLELLGSVAVAINEGRLVPDGGY